MSGGLSNLVGPGGEALAAFLADLSPPDSWTVLRQTADVAILCAAAPRPRPHWLVVTAGLTELAAKESPHADVSGFGFELALRVPRSDARAPDWAGLLLLQLALACLTTGRELEPFEKLPLFTPVDPEFDTGPNALLLFDDPGIPSVSGPFGGFGLLLGLALHQDELDFVKTWDPVKFLEFFAKERPGLLSDPGRPSLFANPSIAGTLRRRADKDGSSQDEVLGHVRWGQRVTQRGLEISLGALVAQDLQRLLGSRLAFGRPFLLHDVGEGQVAVGFRPGDAASATIDDDVLVITMPPDLAREVAPSFPTSRGSYAWPEIDDLILTIIPSEVRTPEGVLRKTVG